MTLCNAVTVVKDQGVNKLAVALLCRSWLCERCEPLRQTELRHLVESGLPTSFITLTVRGRDDGQQAERARRLRSAWQTVVLRAKREAIRDPMKTPRRKLRARHFPDGPAEDGAWPRQVTLPDGKLPFIAVMEQTKKGEPHIHAAARAQWIERLWLSREMATLINAPVVGIERPHSPENLAWYLTKYFSKAPHAWPGCKRYWRSQDYALGDAPEADELVALDATWERIEEPLEAVVAAAVARSWRAEWQGNSARLWRP